MAVDPNMKCVCGFRRFRESVLAVTEGVESWLLYDVGTWGLFAIDVARTHKILACESCGRARSDRVIGGLGAYGAYDGLDGYVYILVTDASVLGCARARYTSVDHPEYYVDVAVAPHAGAADPVTPGSAPISSAPTPPAGAVVADVIRAALPDGSILYDGDYVLTLVDICVGTSSEDLLVVALEAAGLLTEDGDSLLTEDGDNILLE